MKYIFLYLKKLKTKQLINYKTDHFYPLSLNSHLLIGLFESAFCANMGKIIILLIVCFFAIDMLVRSS